MTTDVDKAVEASRSKRRRHRRSVIMRLISSRELNPAQPRRVFVADDVYSQNVLQKRKYKLGQRVSASIKTPRDPMFFRKAHALATAVIENVDDFSDYVAHQDEHIVLKRLQIESKVCCEPIGIDGGLIFYVPQTLCFEEMEEEEFLVFYSGICAYISKRYWPGLDQAAIEQIAAFSADQG